MPRREKIVLVCLLGALLILFIVSAIIRSRNTGQATSTESESGSFLKNTSRFESKITRNPIDHFSDEFLNEKTLEEAGALYESSDAHWWLNSGAYLTIASGIARTVQGDLSEGDNWFIAYARNNPTDTDVGFHPQNIFRLVETDKWNDFNQEMYFKVNKLNQSDSRNRNASNGLFLFNRYQTGDNLYYTGIRVDGAAVIKKKYAGAYYTMAYKPIFDGGKYDRSSNPNLLPLDKWLGLKSEVTTSSDGTVSVKLFTDIGKTGVWQLALEAVDDGKRFGGKAITDAGYAGIRTDFMDVSFSDYSIMAIPLPPEQP